VAKVIARSTTVAGLLSLDNPSSRLRLQLSVAKRAATSERQTGRDDLVGTRGVRITANTGSATYRIKRESEARSQENSLVLQVQASEECYLTVVDVDAQGGVALLFPNELSEQRGYLAGGRVPAGQAVRIPDSLADDNAAGFWLDYAEPPGIDTVRVFATTDPAIAETIRAAVHRLEASKDSDPATAAQDREQVLTALAEQLQGVATRGIRIAGVEVVRNQAKTGTGQASALAPDGPAEETTEAPAGEASTTKTFDWTAASITLRVIRV
jgi:hypothetical protein